MSSVIILKSDLNTKILSDTEGITILAKHNIWPGPKLVENLGYLWLRLENSFFNLENDLFLFGAYIVPKNKLKIYYLNQTTLAL